MGLVTACLLAFTYFQSRKLEEEKHLLLEQYQPVTEAGSQYRAHVHKAVLMVQAYLNTGNEEYRVQWEALWQEKINPEVALLSTAEKLLDAPAFLNALRQIKTSSPLLQAQQEELIGRIQQQLKAKNYYAGGDKASLSYTKEGIERQIQESILPQALESDMQATLLHARLNNLSHETAQRLDEEIQLLRTGGYTALAVCLLMGITLGYFLISQIFRSLYNIKLAVKELRKGNLPEEVKQSRNETAHIVAEINTLTSHLRNVEQLALRVGKGEFDQAIDVFENQGALGESLAGMKTSLSQVAKEDRQRNWVNEGFAKFGDIMRAHNHSITALCDVAISQLVKYLGANQGAIFLIEGKGNETEPAYLNLTSCYAYDKKKYLNKQIWKGEGLAGQAWQENGIILINDIPEDYVNIRSGLGGSNPRAVLMVPLQVNEETQGILELASFKDFEPHQTEFIQKVGENLAAAIGNVRNSERTLNLLEESQELAEAMRAQEEEMRQNMEELEATQEEMFRAQTETIRKEHNLNSVINNTTDTIFALDREYTITVVNQVLKEKYKRMGIMLETGTKLSDILPKSAWEKWKVRYDRALAGEQYSITEESSGSSGTRYSQTYHNPIRDENGEIVGVSVISRDVTEAVQNQKEVQRKQSTMNSIINSTDDTYFAIDTDYRILVANKTLKDRFAVSGISLEEGEIIFDKLAEDKRSYWKDLYDRSLAGESFTITQERPVGEKMLFIEVYCNPIRDEDSGQVIGASVMSRDVTKWKAAIDEKQLREEELNKLRKTLGMENSAEEQFMKKAAKEEKKLH